VSFLSQPTRFITRVGPDIFNGIARFHRNKHCFIAYNKLFLEKSIGPTFANIGSLGWGLQFYSYEKQARFQVRKAKFSRFYICHDMCIGSSRCCGCHGTTTTWFCDVVDTNFIKVVHPNMRCAIPITTNSYHKMGEARHL
jgi:hypothetical protein